MRERSFLTNFARDQLETLNLRRFFGDYRTFDLAPEAFHLGIGEIANITRPETWQHLMQSFHADPRIVSRATMYAGTRGEREANEAVAAHAGQLLGRPGFGEQHVVFYDGGHNAINGILRACVAPIGSSHDMRQYVLLPTPCYPYFPTIMTQHSGALAYVAYAAEDVVQGIESLINPRIGVVLLNAPHNPTGYALTPEHVARINRAVAPYDCIVAVDMVYALNALAPRALEALAGLDPERTIYIDSFSKKFGLPGFRLGYVICANLEIIEALRMMKAAESISVSNVKLLFGAYLLRQHMAIAEATAEAIRHRYHAFREAIDGIEAYGVELPPPTDHANTFYLPIFLDRLLQRTGLSADAFRDQCEAHYRLEVVPGTHMYPPAGLAQGQLKMSRGKAQIETHGPIVYAPDFAQRKRPFLRLSFGIEDRTAEAAARLQQACAETFCA